MLYISQIVCLQMTQIKHWYLCFLSGFVDSDDEGADPHNAGRDPPNLIWSLTPLILLYLFPRTLFCFILGLTCCSIRFHEFHGQDWRGTYAIIVQRAWLDQCESSIIYERKMQSQVLCVIPITSVWADYMWCLWGRRALFCFPWARNGIPSPGHPVTQRRMLQTGGDDGTSTPGPWSGHKASSGVEWSLGISIMYNMLYIYI